MTQSRAIGVEFIDENGSVPGVRLRIALLPKPARSAEVESLALEIAGEGANPNVIELARRVAEAQVDLVRVRNARHELLCSQFNYSMIRVNNFIKGARNVLRIVSGYLRREGPDVVLPPEVVQYAEYVLHWQPQGPEKLLYILSDFSHRLIAMDRYERRALSRRKFAVRVFDLGRRQAMRSENTLLATAGDKE